MKAFKSFCETVAIFWLGICGMYLFIAIVQFFTESLPDALGYLLR